MSRLIKEERGVLSIALAIFIPVIVLGVLYIYAMLDKPQQENTAHKIVFASSESYLSRYNAYLFEQMGILANLDSDVLEPMIVHYLMRNRLIENHASTNLEITYEQLNDPRVFKEAILEAATVLIGNAIVDYGVNLLDQFAFTEKIRTLNHTIQNYEKKLSEQFDKSGASQYLRTIEVCQDIESGRRELDALKTHLNAQNDQFLKSIEALTTELTRIKTSIENPQQAMTTFIKGKETQWLEIEAAFKNEQQAYFHILSVIEALYDRIESDEVSVNRLTMQTEAEKLKKPLNLDKIEQLIALRAKIEGEISNSYSEIESIVSEKLDAGEESPPTLTEVLKNLLLEAEYLFSGIEIGSGALNLDDAFKHSLIDSYESESDAVTKIKMNEYFLSIFSSYDRNCPRVFDPQNRHKTLRTIKGETEYLISGLSKEKQSISLVRLKIVAIRSAANMVTLLSDKDKLTQISTVTAALPQPWQSLAYGAAIVTWSGVESYSDINRLMKGEGFYFLKTKAQWALGLDALLEGSWKNNVSMSISDKLNDTDSQNDDNNPKSNNQIPNVMDPNMFYLDYLRLLLLIQDEQTTLLRAMDLIEAELIDTTEGKTSLINFSRGHVIDLTWMPQGLFGLFSEEASTIHMRNRIE